MVRLFGSPSRHSSRIRRSSEVRLSISTSRRGCTWRHGFKAWPVAIEPRTVARSHSSQRLIPDFGRHELGTNDHGPALEAGGVALAVVAPLLLGGPRKLLCLFLLRFLLPFLPTRPS